jgi:hypothetical protein
MGFVLSSGTDQARAKSFRLWRLEAKLMIFTDGIGACLVTGGYTA